MERTEQNSVTELRVIDGSGQPPRRRIENFPLPDAPKLDSHELAFDMAELFAMGLLSDQSFDDLENPHSEFTIDVGTKFELHELLGELRCLPWSDLKYFPDTTARSAVSRSASSSSSEAELEDAGRRRAIRLNGDDQLTLRTMLRPGVALREAPLRLSALFETDSSHTVPEGPMAPPADDEPMSAWTDWCARHSGAGLSLPGLATEGPLMNTPADLAEHVQNMPAARPFHSAALTIVANGTPFDPGLDPMPGQETTWTGSRLFSLLAEAETRARHSALKRLTRQERLQRPVVTAARMTVHLAREERHQDGADIPYRAAADELAIAAPNLLAWVSRANLIARGKRRQSQNLFLPMGRAMDIVRPSDLACHVVVAGALSTILKALIDTNHPRRLRLAAAENTPMYLSDELDRLAANISAARVVAGSHYPAENFQDLRLGQAIGLQVLREALEADNRSARLSFRDFDGRSLLIHAHPRHFGRGLAELRCGSEGLPWPQEAAPPKAHLTAVV